LRLSLSDRFYTPTLICPDNEQYAGCGCGGLLRGVAIMKSRSLGIATAVAFFSIVSPVSADMVTVTYIGTVQGGFDQLGVFGTPNTSLTGDPYTLVYTFNTAIGLDVSVPGFPQSLVALVRQPTANRPQHWGP
jgi:hypothetical protein